MAFGEGPVEGPEGRGRRRARQHQVGGVGGPQADEGVDEAGVADEAGAIDPLGFDDVIKSAKVPVLVDFWAGWCGPCRMAAPQVEATAKAMQGRALVLKVDTEKNPALAARFGVRGIPHFVVLQGGAPVFEHSGLVDTREMQRWLSR